MEGRVVRVGLGLIAVLIVMQANGAEAPVAESTLKDQTAVAVTAYNNGLALIRDDRAVALPSGETHLRFADVAAQIRPETVSLRSVSAPGSVAILEQNYEYDLIKSGEIDGEIRRQTGPANQL